MNIQPVPAGPGLPINRIDGAAISETGTRFNDYVAASIDQVNEALARGDQAVERLHSGEAQSLHEVMIAVEEADISLRMFVQVRNKALQAYEEIMRLQL